jgi:hypothetical protein
MTDLAVHTDTPDHDTTNTVPTAVFFADPRATTFLLADTIGSLLAAYSIQHAYVDLTTLGGVTVAGELLRAGVAYTLLDFGQQVPTAPADHTAQFDLEQPRSLADIPYLSAMSADTLTVKVEELAAMNANLVLIPAMADERLIDFSPNSLVGAVLVQAEEIQRDVLVLSPPQRGLRCVPTPDSDVAPERYELQTLLIRVDDTQE